MVENIITLLLSLLSPILGLWMGRDKKISLWYYLLISIVIDFVALILKKIGCPHSLLSNLFLILEFWFVSYYFKQNLWSKKWNKTYWTTMLMISLMFLINTYKGYLNASTDMEAFNFFDAAFFYIVYILLSILSMYKIMKEFNNESKENYALLLASVAFVLYASGTFLLLLFKNHLIDEDLKSFALVWVYFFRPLNTLKNILLAFSLKNVPKSSNIRTH